MAYAARDCLSTILGKQKRSNVSNLKSVSFGACNALCMCLGHGEEGGLGYGRVAANALPLLWARVTAAW